MHLRGATTMADEAGEVALEAGDKPVDEPKKEDEEWQAVTKPQPRRLAPQHTLSKADLGEVRTCAGSNLFDRQPRLPEPRFQKQRESRHQLAPNLESLAMRGSRAELHN